MPGGRPSKYNPEFHPKLAEAWAKSGLTDEQIAGKLEISVKTVDLWKTKHPEFLGALKKGKEDPDEKVEKSLYERAIGYSQPAVKIFMPAGASEPIYAEYIERLPPDPTSMIYWLKNRRPDKWRERKDEAPRDKDIPPLNIHISGKPDPKDLDPEQNDNLEVSSGKDGA